MPTWSTFRTSIFKQPKKSAAIVGAASFLPLLIPTLIFLLPLDKAHRYAKKDRDAAQDDINNTKNDIRRTLDQIAEARQRVLDLECAMGGYQQFNLNVMDFQRRLQQSGGFPIERLRAFWRIAFDAERTQAEQLVDKDLIYEDKERVTEVFYSCFHTNPCPDDKSCCYALDTHTVTTDYKYDLITTIIHHYQGIITGSPIQFALNCGYYGRDFHTNAPSTYIVSESPHIESGDKMNGAYFVNYNQEHGSSLSYAYTLDGATSSDLTYVMRTEHQDLAAVDLYDKLMQFLAYAISAFNLAGTDYPLLQDNIRQSIPKLLGTVASLNDTLHDEYDVLADAEAKFDVADENYYNGLKLWLPIFFLSATGMGFMAYYLILCWKKQVDARHAAEVLDSYHWLERHRHPVASDYKIEAPESPVAEPRVEAPKRYSPMLYSNNPVVADSSPAETENTEGYDVEGQQHKQEGETLTGPSAPPEEPPPAYSRL